MGTTPCDLFRSGDSTSARLDRVRQTEVDTWIDAAGQVWVKANGRGISTSSSVDASWSGKPWKLDAGSVFPDELEPWESPPGHWYWAPKTDMLLSDYEKALSIVNGEFHRV